MPRVCVDKQARTPPSAKKQVDNELQIRFVFANCIALWKTERKCISPVEIRTKPANSRKRCGNWEKTVRQSFRQKEAEGTPQLRKFSIQKDLGASFADWTRQSEPGEKMRRPNADSGMADTELGERPLHADREQS
jgi:hypothetical protein